MLDLARLKQTLGTAELKWFVDRVRQRLERGGGIQGAVTLRQPTAAQRAALERLLGRPASRGGSLSVRLDQLDDLLRHAELCGGLVEAIEALTGPLVEVRAERAAVEAQWESVFAEAQLRAPPLPPLVDWLSQLRTSGLLRRLSGNDVTAAERLLEQALAAIGHLPTQGMPLAELAAVVAGDSHALDVGRPLGTLVLRAAAALGGVESAETEETDGRAPRQRKVTTKDAEARRGIWASVGVLCDELSAPVLVLNLRAGERTFTGRALGLHAECGEPYRVTVRQLLRSPPDFDPAAVGRTVHVCENPTVVAAAANRLGSQSAGLVCLEGQPKTAARLLLSRLAASGVRLAYHGDFDWDGIRIANLVMRRHGAVAWRMDTLSYLRAAGGAPLRGSPVPASWDADLLPAMLKAGRAVHEEQALAELLSDLAAGAAESNIGICLSNKATR